MGTLRYTRVAIGLHWLIAILILINLLLGWWMHEAIDEPARQALAIVAFQWHKSIGLSVLALVLLRLVWRATHRPPAPPPMPRVQQQAATAVHWLLYGLMALLPLSGWVLVSTQWRGDAPLVLPTLYFGRLEIPHLLGLHEATDGVRQNLSMLARMAHEWLAWGMLLLVAAHAGAALHHQFGVRDGLLTRMRPTLSTGLMLGAVLLLIPVLLMNAPTRSGEQQIQSFGEGWPIDAETSEITYSGSHAGLEFRGRFERWRVEFVAYPADLAQSRLRVEIDTASARDGDPLHDETLPEAEWFDVGQHPLAVFELVSVGAPDAQGARPMTGKLRIKQQSRMIEGLLLRPTPSGFEIRGDLHIDRADFDIGMESDPAGQWVSRDIRLQIRAVFTAPD